MDYGDGRISRWQVCKESDTPPLWKMDQRNSTKLPIEYGNNNGPRYRILADQRTLISETEDKYLKFIQNAALCILALNCGIIGYWWRQYKPILDDYRTNHGAENENGERNGQPRNQFSICGWESIGLNRFIIGIKFLSKIFIPFVDSITGK